MKLKDQGSFELASSRHVGESWYMNWTRNVDTSPGKNRYGLVFVEAKLWLLRVRFFPEKSATRLVRASIGSAVPGRGRDLNSAVVDDYVNSIEPPISVLAPKKKKSSVWIRPRTIKALDGFGTHVSFLCFLVLFKTKTGPDQRSLSVSLFWWYSSRLYRG